MLSPTHYPSGATHQLVEPYPTRELLSRFGDLATLAPLEAARVFSKLFRSGYRPNGASVRPRVHQSSYTILTALQADVFLEARGRIDSIRNGKVSAFYDCWSTFTGAELRSKLVIQKEPMNGRVIMQLIRGAQAITIAKHEAFRMAHCFEGVQLKRVFVFTENPEPDRKELAFEDDLDGDGNTSKKEQERLM
ncbi:hypothetical protein RhiJN_06176 [Ceratobasidium sp. AG-Ba]|nr:hypothetical protein RhiJN_06176 [Ceratobasidium sp. AG-Ba]